MHDDDLLFDRRDNTSAHPKVCRLDGSEAPIRLRLLGYNSCEFECDARFAPGESIKIHLYRMGWIRARITSVRPPVAEAEFAKECLV